MEDKGLKVNVGKTKMMVSRTEGEIVCCTQCMKWIHGRCTKMKKVTCSFARHFVCRKCTDVEDGTEELVKVLCDRERPGQQFWPGLKLQPRNCTCLQPRLGFIQCFMLCLEYIAKQASCVLTPHVNAVSDVT